MNCRMNLGVEVILAFLIVTFGNVSCSSQNPTRRMGLSPDEVDVTKPLILSDVMDFFWLDERYDHLVRDLARVNHPDLRGVESYAGYIKNTIHTANHFFWYFPAKESPENAPVVLYLEGTPGKNMFFSIFTQNGPFSIGSSGQLVPRPESWNNKHHMIYMDSMPGFGYAFQHERNHTMVQQVPYVLTSVSKQFFKIFPSIRRNPFFLAGNYYSWTHLPVLASTLHDLRVNFPNSNEEINFKGVIIANGLVNPEEQFIFGDHLYTIGLIDDNEKREFDALEDRFKLSAVRSDHIAFYDNFERLMMGRNSLFGRLTGYHHPYSILEDELPPALDDAMIKRWITRGDVRRALHIGDRQQYHPLSGIELADWKQFVNRAFSEELRETFQNYRVLIYTGNLDILCPYPSVEKWLGRLSWPNKHQFAKAERQPWRDSSNQLAGYIKKTRNIVESVIINAGHYPCFDQPKRTLELVEGFTHDTL